MINVNLFVHYVSRCLFHLQKNLADIMHVLGKGLCIFSWPLFYRKLLAIVDEQPRLLQKKDLPTDQIAERMQETQGIERTRSQEIILPPTTLVRN